RNLRALLQLLRPYRRRSAAMLVALLIGTAATLAPPLLAKVAIDQGISKHDTKTLVLVVIAFLVSALLVWLMTYAQTYLVGWVGQRALAAPRIRIFTHLQSPPLGFSAIRPSPARAPARLLREPAGRRADLAHDQRRGGARQPRHRLRRDALPVRPD